MLKNDMNEDKNKRIKELRDYMKSYKPHMYDLEQKKLIISFLEGMKKQIEIMDMAFEFPEARQLLSEKMGKPQMMTKEFHDFSRSDSQYQIRSIDMLLEIINL